MISNNIRSQHSFRITNIAAKLLSIIVPSAFLIAAATAAAQDNGRRPDVLAKVVRGAKAIQVLGDRLPQVAREHKMRTKELRRTLRTDRTLAVGRDLMLFYTDTHLPEHGTTTQAADTSTFAATGYSLEDTFKMHSKPGSKKTIYLDFDGHYLKGTAWNWYGTNKGTDIDAPAWSLDAYSATFNDLERKAIQEIWARVAEDYAPFDVNVTTEYTGEDAITRSDSKDEYYGTRALISPISQYFGYYGGIAYVGIFSNVGDYYKPALIFPENLENKAKSIAEAISHEVGHNLNLHHDGTTTGTEYYKGHDSGETGWAPIMGNSYSQPLSQWSKGEYPNANNTQDDLAVINSHIPFRADDHGDTAATATALPLSNSFSAFGIINSPTDIDMFKFNSGDGSVSITVTPEDLGPNLDILIQLRDAQGRILASANPLEQLATSLSIDVSTGTYYISIEGVGKGELSTGYSAYGSLGQYILTGMLSNTNGEYPPVALASASITSGDAPLAVSFSGSRSSDVDGTIVSYHWDFGDGTSSTAADPTHTYADAGVFLAVLTVTDNSGLTGSASVKIESLAPNMPPVADLKLLNATGYAPLNVTLDASGSFDPDGSIASYNWSFGDGTSATTQEAVVNHTYKTIGTFTAGVTVADNRGAVSSAEGVVKTSQDPAMTLKVGAINLTVVAAAKPTKPGEDTTSNKKVEATVLITDTSGKPLPGATVSATWSGLVRGSSTATTNSSGIALMSSKATRKSGTVTLTITGVSLNGYTYDTSQNTISKASITVS